MIAVPRHPRANNAAVSKEADWPPCRLSKYLRQCLRWSDDQIAAAVRAGRVSVTEGTSSTVATDPSAFVFPPAATPDRASEPGPPSVVAVDGVAVQAWDTLRDTRVFALHKPRGLEVTLARSNSHSKTRKFRDFSSWLDALRRLPVAAAAAAASVRSPRSKGPLLQSHVDQDNYKCSGDDDGATEGECEKAATGRSCCDKEGIGATTAVASKNPSPCSRSEVIAALQRASRDNLFYIGRLDKPTSGLLLVTNDGELSQLLCEPGAVCKEYIATVRRPPTEAERDRLLEGVALKDSRGEYIAKADALAVLQTRVFTQTIVPSNKKLRKRNRHTVVNSERGLRYNDGDTSCAPAASKPTTHSNQTSLQAAAASGDDGRRGLNGSKKADNVGGGGGDGRITVSHQYTDVRLIMRTGRFRVVRRMLAAVGLGVVHLHRAAVGPVRLRGNAAWKHAGLPTSPPVVASDMNYNATATTAAATKTPGDHALISDLASSEPKRQAAVSKTAGKCSISSSVGENALVDTAFSVELAPEQHSELTAEQKSWLWQAVGGAVLPQRRATTNGHSTRTGDALRPPERPSWPYHGRARALQTLLQEQRRFGGAAQGEHGGRKAPCTEAEAQKIRHWLFRHGYTDSG